MVLRQSVQPLSSRSPSSSLFSVSGLTAFSSKVECGIYRVCLEDLLELHVPPSRASTLRSFRWSELTRKIEFNVEVQELGESGDYAAVEVQPRDDVGAGGVFQLRQGQQRRILVSVRPVANSGTLPIICESVMSISVGSPCVRSKLQKPLDSYHEEDLNQLRKKWTEALGRRREVNGRSEMVAFLSKDQMMCTYIQLQYLDSQIQKYINKAEKTETEREREQSLVDQWVCLTEERNSVMCPAAGSGVPGAPADWEPPDGVEAHSPVLFLDLNADDLSTGKYLTHKLVKVDSLHAFNCIAFVSRSRRTHIQVIRVVCTYLRSIFSQATRKRVKYPFSEPTLSCRRSTAVNSSTCPSFATSRATSGLWPTGTPPCTTRCASTA